MQGIPVPISNVTVAPYLGVPIQVQPVLTGASGTYTVGTLTTHIFYNMSLSGGKAATPLQVGAQYYASYTDANGNPGQTHYMTCLTAGAAPTFGLTVSMVHPGLAAATPGSDEGPYIELEQLVDFTLAYELPPPQIGSVEVSLGKKGRLIGTRVGTPHLMGFQIDNPTLPSFVTVGTKNLSISAKTTRGETVNYGRMTCEEAGNPAIFLQTFP